MPPPPLSIAVFGLRTIPASSATAAQALLCPTVGDEPFRGMGWWQANDSQPSVQPFRWFGVQAPTEPGLKHL